MAEGDSNLEDNYMPWNAFRRGAKCPVQRSGYSSSRLQCYARCIVNPHQGQCHSNAICRFDEEVPAPYSSRLLDRSLNRRRQQLRPPPPVYRLVEQDVYNGKIPGSRDGSIYEHVIFANDPFHRLHLQPVSLSAEWPALAKRKSIANVNVL